MVLWLWLIISPFSIVTHPSSQDADLLSFIIAGKIDIPNLLANPSLVCDEFRYEMSGKQHIVLDDVVWISKYRWALTRSLVADTDYFSFHIGLIFVWSTSLGSGKCSWLEVSFIQLEYGWLFSNSITDGSHCHSPTGSQGPNSSIRDSVS